MSVYIDTSALAKWYLNEPGSDAFEAWIRDVRSAQISSLTVAEMRSLLARHRRMGQLDSKTEDRVYDRFVQDIDERHLVLHPVADPDVRAAAHLIGQRRELPLRTLDAIHLTICRSRELAQIATADAVMAAAATQIGIKVVRFP